MRKTLLPIWVKRVFVTYKLYSKKNGLADSRGLQGTASPLESQEAAEITRRRFIAEHFSTSKAEGRARLD